MTALLACPEAIPCLAPLRGKQPSAVEIAAGPLATPCWIWTGCVNSKGYPVRGTQHGRYLVHRRVFEEAFGPLPAGHEAHHRCEAKRCVNPQHLDALTHVGHAREHGDRLTVGLLVAEWLREFGPARVAPLAHVLGVSPASVANALRRGSVRGEFVRLDGRRWAVPALQHDLEEAA